MEKSTTDRMARIRRPTRPGLAWDQKARKEFCVSRECVSCVGHTFAFSLLWCTVFNSPLTCRPGMAGGGGGTRGCCGGCDKDHRTTARPKVQATSRIQSHALHYLRKKRAYNMPINTGVDPPRDCGGVWLNS